MKKQYIFLLSGLAIVLSLYFFGKTVSENKPSVPFTAPKAQIFDIQNFISQKKSGIPAVLLTLVNSKEDSLGRFSDSLKKSGCLTQLANLWRDSLHVPEIYAHYISEASKLDNSEKNLTFAGQLFLELLRSEQDQAKLEWESAEAISFFQKAIELNPSSDDLKINLASCFIYGKGRSGDPAETMKGIQQLLSVVRKDSTNMKAQMLLGVGGFVSGQYDKAIVRLKKVVEQQPDNVEAVAFLADTYAAQGNTTEAIRWYDVSKKMVNNPDYSKEVDARIKQLQNK